MENKINKLEQSGAFVYKMLDEDGNTQAALTQHKKDGIWVIEAFMCEPDDDFQNVLRSVFKSTKYGRIIFTFVNQKDENLN